MVFRSPSVCQLEPRLMALLMHQSLNDCVLSLWRKGAAKLAMECCFFMSASIDKCKTVQAAIRQAGFIELNHPVYSPNIALTYYHPLSNLKKFVRGKNFSFDDEPVTTVENYFTDLIQSFFVKAYKVCMTAGSVWLLVKVSTFNKYDNYLSTVKQYISCTNFRDNLIAVKIRLNRLTIFLRMFALMVTNYRHWSSLTSTRVFLFVMSGMAIGTSLLKSSVSIVLKTATANNRLKRHFQIYWKRSICCEDYTCSHIQNSLNCTCSLAISNRS